MRFRKLRIAWSVFWGLACVLLIVLWMRSYSTLYWCYGFPHSGQVLHLHAAEGLLILFDRDGTPAWEVGSLPRKNLGRELEKPYTGYHTTKRMSVQSHPGKPIAKLPIWLGVALLLICACASWTTRFSLRTLLIATTLVAVVLGSAVWAANR